MVDVSKVAVLLSATAILLSLIAIRRQSIPSKYEAERRIREKFEIPNDELNFEYNGTNYHINYINVIRRDGLSHRSEELVFGDLSGETQIVFTMSDQPRSTIETEYISTIDEEGVRALMFKMDTAHPSELYNQFCESAFELSKQYN